MDARTKLEFAEFSVFMNRAAKSASCLDEPSRLRMARGWLRRLTNRAANTAAKGTGIQVDG